MKTSKTWMMAMGGAAMLTMAGCAGGTSQDGPTATTEGAQKGPVSAQQVSGLLSKEEGTPLSDYQATYPSYRVLGVQPGDGQHGFVTLMDTRTYDTRNVGVGEALSRNVLLTGLTEHGADFQSTTDGTLHVEEGGELRTLQITHVFDRTVDYLGKHAYQVHPDAASQVLAHYGVGAAPEAVQVFGQSGIRLDGVTASGALARLGFEEGDILLAVNGGAATMDLAGLAGSLTRPASQDTVVTVSRRGNVASLHFSVR